MPKKLLLADDSVTIQKVISITFASDDYELVIVGDGDSAISKAREVDPDIILADIAMPGKNGYEVCEAVKCDPALSHIPVMLLAGTFEPLDNDEATRVKANDSIVKPFESQELVDKVNSILASSILRDDTQGDESTFELPDEDFGVDAIPGLDGPDDAGADLDFLEGGIFEEPMEQNVAHLENSFVDLEISDEEMTTEDSEPELQDISAAIAPEVPEEPKEAESGGDDFAVSDGFDSDGSFSFESEAESLEVVELEDMPEDIFESEPESVSESVQAPLELEQFGTGLEQLRPNPEPFETTGSEKPEAAPYDSEEIAVDYSTPGLELESKVPEPGASFEPGEPEEIAESPVSEPDLEVEESEPVIGEVSSELELEPEHEPLELDDAALEELEPESEPEPELEPVQEFELEPETASTFSAESVVEAAVEAVTEQSLDEITAATESVSGSLPAEVVEEIVAKTAKEVIEKVVWEVVPEMAEELINAEIKKFKEAMLHTK